MSSAVFPLGMNSMPASGYGHHSTYYNKQYASWKGTGVNSNPTGTAPGHIRPLTNLDPGNVFQTGFGLPRPLKQYRKGRVIPPNPGPDNVVAIGPFTVAEGALINYNTNRFVASSKGTSLGGGFGGSGLLNEMQDKPGAFIVKLNTVAPAGDGEAGINASCKTCEGVGIVASYYPNKGYLTENPEPNTTNPVWCCNEERKARRRVVYANTNLNKNYYTTTKQYLQNRCKTYDQKAFNFLAYRTNPPDIAAGVTPGEVNPYYATPQRTSAAKPGGPIALAESNMYLANCQSNVQLYEGSELAFIYQMLAILVKEDIIPQSTADEFTASGINTIQGFFNWIQGLPDGQRQPALVVFEVFINNPYWGMPPSGPTNPAGCQLTVYKPNNYQYAKQGAVSSSTRMLKLNVDVISTNAASIQNNNNTGAGLITANELSRGNDPDVAGITKNKAPACSAPWPINMSQSGPFQNKKFCHYQKQLPVYQVPVSQPGTQRYYPAAVFSSNHYSQSPNTYNTTAGSAAHM